MKIERLTNFELRGICFIQAVDGTWERNILMNKFFNYSQTLGWMPEDLDNKKIVRVQDKCDGSIISFCRFKNGKVRAKSKMSFISDQSQMAQKIYDTDEKLQDFIAECIHKDKTPIFELVGPMNIIVLSYQKDELLLLQIRDNKTGKYEDFHTS